MKSGVWRGRRTRPPVDEIGESCMPAEMAGEQGRDQDSTAVFRLLRPVSPGPFVFASPHSGEIYPADMAPSASLSERSLKSAADAWVDRLIAPAVERGVTVLTAQVARAYLDLNRAPDELDPQLIEGAPVAASSPRAAAGYGVVPRLSGDGRPMYERRLSRDEAEARVARVHAPYHAALAAVMAETKARWGRAILVDWHSMPARAVGGARGVDVVLGDRHGAACDAQFMRRTRAAFERLGWRVALNHPYAGGWTTSRWGRPVEGCHALQIELSRALYLDEASGQPGAGWSRCAAGVAQVIAALVDDV